MNKLLTAVIVVGLGFAATGVLAGQAQAAPRGTYIETPIGPDDVLYEPTGGPLTLYLNGDGATYTQGNNNAYQNRSNILGSPAVIPPFGGTAAEWEYLVDCVRYQYARFNIIVTDEDPGNVSQIEASVGGSPEDAGMKSHVGGVAPYTCQPLASSVVFNFSEKYGSDMDQLCFTIAQESAHALSLDHEFDCNDPMTYLDGCGFKTFQDEDIACGTDEPTNCNCGMGPTQNSVELLTFYLGLASDNAPPTVSISQPIAGGYLAVGQAITAAIADDRAIERVEWWLDGVKQEEQRFGPYSFAPSLNTPLGPHSIEVRVVDIADKEAVDAVEFTLTVNGEAPECATNDECGDEEVCYQLQCWPANIERGALGATCEDNADCLSSICGSDGTDHLCTQQCNGDCPDGFDCVSAGGTDVCWPGNGGGNEGDDDDDDGGAGCATETGGGGASGGALAALICGLGLMLMRRRRA